MVKVWTYLAHFWSWNRGCVLSVLLCMLWSSWCQGFDHIFWNLLWLRWSQECVYMNALVDSQLAILLSVQLFQIYSFYILSILAKSVRWDKFEDITFRKENHNKPTCKLCFMWNGWRMGIFMEHSSSDNCSAAFFWQNLNPYWNRKTRGP